MLRSHTPTAGPSPQSMHSGLATDKGKVRVSPSPDPVRTPSPHGALGAGQPLTMTMHSHTAMLAGLMQTVAMIHCQTTDMSVWLAVLEQCTSVLEEFIQKPTGSTANLGPRQPL